MVSRPIVAYHIAVIWGGKKYIFTSSAESLSNLKLVCVSSFDRFPLNPV